MIIDGVYQLKQDKERIKEYSKQPWLIPDERLRGIFAAGGFELKKRLEDAAILRKGSWAQGGESTTQQLIRLGKKQAGTAIGNKVSSILGMITGKKNK